MDSDDTVVAPKILGVIRENMRYAVNLHRCDEASIVALLSRNTIAGHEGSPFGANGIRIITQSYNRIFNTRKNSAGLIREKAQSVILGWPRANGPALDEVLSGYA